MWRDMRLPHKLTALLSDYLPPSIRFQESLEQLNALGFKGWSPWRSEAVGLDMRRGLALMRARGGAWRLIAAHQPETHLEAIAELREALSFVIPVRARDLLCAPAQDQRGAPLEGWLRCDSEPLQPAPAPAWLNEELARGAVWAYVRDPAALMSALSLPALPLNEQWRAASVHLDLEGDELSASVEVQAPFHPLFGLLNTPQTSHDALTWVHPSSPLTLTLNLNTDLLITYAPLLSAHPWLMTLGALAEQGWRGGATLTFDGGLDHPVLLLELKDSPWAWRKLAGELARALNATLSEEDDTGLAWLNLGDERSGQWTLPLGHTPQHLTLGLFRVDVMRRLSGRFTPLAAEHLRPLSERGVSGLFVDIGALKPSYRRVELSTLTPVLSTLLSGRFDELVDVPYGALTPPIELASALARYEELSGDPLIERLSIHPQLSTPEGLKVLKALTALHEFMSVAVEATEGLTLTTRAYLGALSRLRFEARLKLL